MRKKWYKHTTFWITLWAVGFLTYGLLANSNTSWMAGVSQILAGAIAIYIGGNKAIEVRHGPENEKEK